ncbi:MAG TPA: hypothetical protein ENI17_05925 [Pseudomonas xinjiangensis]|uniref:Uncharacterized protein n=2 Tax=root TaxID=1 RepID=A0A7V1BM84_9GAMM|nr:hypothetical protein [Halopseudomonas xinjiangensis]HEC47150.1 hypothetical protein [Halopseudomonas xinjiangensis]
MASKSLGTLTLDLIARTGGFVAGMDKAERQSAKWRKQVEKDVKATGKAMGVALTAGAAAAATALVLVVNKQRDLIDQQAKMAQRMRTSYESLSTLARAGELAGVSMGQIETASKGLEQRLGQAIQGTVAQKEAFDRLHLSAQAIADLPLDQRIGAINKALRENVQASERAAVAGKIFGEEGAITMQMLDPDTIAEAARQIEIFGLNLSDVDAAKVEMANDAMSTLGSATTGLSQQLTVELAPILRAIGDEFLRNAEEAGGMGEAVRDAVDKAVTGLAFVMDAGDGVGRVFSISGKLIALNILQINSKLLGMADTFYNGPIEAANVLLEILSKIPGIDLDPYEMTGAGSRIKSDLSIAEGAIAAAQEDITDTLNKPLAGQAFKQFVADAQVAGQAAAEAVIAARRLASAGGTRARDDEDNGKQTEAIQKQISALERAAATWGMDADAVKLWNLEADGASDTQLKLARAHLETVANLELSKEAQKGYADLLKDLRTDEEVLTDQMRERLAVLDAMSGLTENQRNDTAGRIAGAATDEAPEFGGLDATVAGPMGELLKIDDAEEKLSEWYSTQLEILEEFRSERSDLNATWDEEELALKQEHEDKLADIEQARRVVQMAAGEEAFGHMADAARVFFGENSKLYQAAFAVEKAYAIGKALMNVPKSYSDAFAAVVGIPIVGPALAPAAGVAAAAAQVAQAAAIGNVSMTGMAHDGIDFVPKTGTWLLEKGERVTTAETSVKLDNVLNDVQRQSAGRSVIGDMHLHNHVNGTIDRRTSNQMMEDMARKQRMVNARFGR